MARRNNRKKVVGKDSGHSSTKDDLIKSMQTQINRLEQMLRIYEHDEVNRFGDDHERGKL